MDWPLFIAIILAQLAGVIGAYSLGYDRGRADEIRHGNDHEPLKPK